MKLKSLRKRFCDRTRKIVRSKVFRRICIISVASLVTIILFRSTAGAYIGSSFTNDPKKPVKSDAEGEFFLWYVAFFLLVSGIIDTSDYTSHLFK